MRVTIIGATGHTGSYLVPALVRAGHGIVAMSRGQRRPYQDGAAWSEVEQVRIDRGAADADGTFVDAVLATRPDAVVDMLCFTPESARNLVDGLAGRVGRLLMCGTIWVHGPTLIAPTREADPRHPYGDYGVQKNEIERIVLEASDRLPAVVLHPGHISGPGWPVINPVGNLDPAVWRIIAAGEPLFVPMNGVATMHHVHAADVAQGFELALTADAAVGEAFHVVADRATSTRGLAEAAARWFDRDLDLRPVSWDDFERQTTPAHAEVSRNHLERSHVMSIEKARAMLGYDPHHTAQDTAHEAVQWLIGHAGLLPR